jgi:hypothetical protein
MQNDTTTPTTADAVGGVAPRTDGSLADSVTRVQDKVSELGHTAAEKLHRSRMATADALDGTVSGLHNKADRVSELGHEGAAKVGVAARYVREHGTADVLSDVRELTRAHPGKALLSAVAVGFIAARLLRRG